MSLAESLQLISADMKRLRASVDAISQSIAASTATVRTLVLSDADSGSGGNAWRWTVPADRCWQFVTGSIWLEADPTVADRQVVFAANDGVNPIVTRYAATVQAASLSYGYQLGAYADAVMGSQVLIAFPEVTVSADGFYDLVIFNKEISDALAITFQVREFTV